MRNITFSILLGGSLFFSGCNSQIEEIRLLKPKNKPIYSATGLVTEVDEINQTLRINHEEIKGLMAEMEMEFSFPKNSTVDSDIVGRMIDFTVEKKDDDHIVSNFRHSSELNPRKKYLENCARCHGEFGEGRLKGIPFTKGHALSHSEEEFIETVTNGKKKMPSFRDELSDREIKWIVRYVRRVLQRELTTTEKHIH
jgi:Cu/Ag efflux protein CusF